MPKGTKRTRTKRKLSDASKPLKGSTKRRKSDNPQPTQSCSGTPVTESSATITPTLEISNVPAIPNQAGPSRPFHNAHDFVINNLVFGDSATSRSDAEAMKTVTKNIIKGAEHDSSARDPPPRCQEGTRKTLKNNMSVWFEDEKREKKFLWLNGPAGVGKSAVMQTTTESMAEANRLAAAIFFSESNKRNDAKMVVPTLVYQLALRVPGYRPYLVEQIAFDPLVFTKSIRELFRKFIVEPFAVKNIYRTGPTLCILLDGLDECGLKSEQCTIIDLITEFVSQYPAIPLVWIVASRPEDHLKNKFFDPNVAANHWQLYVPIDDDEARRDVECFLRSGFEEVRQRYPNTTSPDWPTEAQFRKVTDRASGLFVFAFTVKRFLEDPEIANPTSQLRVVISVIDGISIPFADNPFATLDALYKRIVEGIPSSVRPAMELLVGHLLIQGDSLQVPEAGRVYPYTLVIVSNILGMSRDVVYSALCKLHSVLFIPSQDEAHDKHISFLHASFSEFLRDAKRAKEFVLNLTDLNTKLWRCWHRIVLQANHDSTRPFADPYAISLSWSSDISITDRCQNRMPFQQILIYEALANWAHYLFPGTCPCAPGGIYNARAPEAGFSIAVSDRLVLLQDLHWNKFASGYFQDDLLHLRHFANWMIQSWEGHHQKLEGYQIGEEIVLQDFGLDLVDTNMVAYERKPVQGQVWLYYSGKEQSYGQIRSFSPIQTLLSDITLLQEEQPHLRVILLGNRTRSAFLVYSLNDRPGCYFLPLKR